VTAGTTSPAKPAYLGIDGRATLQTAVHHYRHPDTGRKVTLVATMCFGDPGYYGKLRELISGCEAGGAVVHCEGSGRVPYDDGDVTADEQTLLGDLRECRDLETARFPTIGWVHRNACLEPGPRWQVHDLSDLAIIRPGRPARNHADGRP
jgi:hypothetical protein